MGTQKWRQVQLFDCPCGYRYEPVRGDPGAGWEPGTPFDALPESLTCPRCQRAKVHFREKRFSVPDPVAEVSKSAGQRGQKGNP